MGERFPTATAYGSHRPVQRSRAAGFSSRGHNLPSCFETMPSPPVPRLSLIERECQRVVLGSELTTSVPSADVVFLHHGRNCGQAESGAAIRGTASIKSASSYHIKLSSARLSTVASCAGEITHSQ